jgi:O-antigen/teichoic acid export membrane protein
LASAKKILKNSLWFTLANLLQKSVGFILLPIYARFLTPDDYGVVAIFTVISTLLSVFFTLSLDSTVVRFFFDHPEDKNYHRRLYGTIYASVAFISIIGCAVCLVVGHFVLPLFLDSVPLYPYFPIALATAALEPFFAIYQSVLLAKQVGRLHASQQVSRVIVVAILSLFLVVGMRLGILGLLLSQLLSALIFAVFSLVQVRREFGFSFDKATATACLRYSLPLVPNKLATYLPNVIDRTLINNSVSASAAGVYSVGAKCSEVLGIVTSSLNRAFSPWFFGAIANARQDDADTVARFSQASVTLVAFSALCGSMFAKEVLSVFFPPSYHEAWRVIPFLAFNHTLAFIGKFWLFKLQYNKAKVGYAPISTYVHVSIMAGLSWILVPEYSIMGAAVALLVSRIVATAVMIVLAERHSGVSLKLPLLAMCTTSLGMMTLASSAYLKWEPVRLIPLKCALVFATAVWIYRQYGTAVMSLLRPRAGASIDGFSDSAE